MRLPNSVSVERRKLLTLYLGERVTADSVLAVLNEPGEVLKSCNKRYVRKVGKWVIKSSRFNFGFCPLKLTIRRQRYRNGWLASLAMDRLGIPVPRTIAYVEYRFLGIIWANAFIHEYIEESIHTLFYSKSLKEAGDESAIEMFFLRLTHALEALTNARVFHRDLKPANILTADGETFYFIDLDEAIVNQDFEPDHRLRNHVQLANGFKSVWDRIRVEQFLRMGIPEGEDPDTWLQQVWNGVNACKRSGEKYN